jgi:hypothetical protein
MTYHTLNTVCDLSAVALAQCLAEGLPAQGEARLHVSEEGTDYALELVRLLYQHSPLKLPTLTVYTDEQLPAHEWFIECNGVAIGSPGP